MQPTSSAGIRLQIHPVPVARLYRLLHIVNDCPDMKFPGGLSALHLAEEEAIGWLGMQSTR